METSTDKIEELVARRLLIQAEEHMKRRDRKKEEPSLQLEVTKQGTLTPPDFVKIEKNLTSLGFFTPSSRRIKNEKAKTITFTRLIDGNRVEAKVTIAPAALYGLPVTADQDKYLAFQHIVTAIQQQQGIVKNPVGFTSSDILRLLNQGDAGKNYQDVAEWLDVMTATTIMSEGAVYFAGKKVFAKDRFHIFDRAVSMGKEIEPGVVADKNYVWLSDWQLENINNNYLLPIDFDTYKQLKNHIAKALVPLLQIWLYASREEGCFEKRYDELCQILAIRQYPHLSEIKRNFAPSLDELKEHGYISKWKLEKTNDKKAYKVIFYHGEKFHRDRHHRLGKRGQPKIAVTPDPEDLLPAAITKKDEPKADHPLLMELTKRGITESGARKFLAEMAEHQPVLDQLEFIDHQAKTSNIKNPPGFYLYLLKENIAVPDDYMTSRKRKLREEVLAERDRAIHDQLKREQAYEDYKHREISRYIESHPDEYAKVLEGKRRRFLEKYPRAAEWESSVLDKTIEAAARTEISDGYVSLYNFETFSALQPAEQPAPPAEQGSDYLTV